MLIRKLLTITIALLISSGAFAAPTIFKTTDKNGNPIFTDMPSEGQKSEAVHLKPMSTVTLTPATTTTDDQPAPTTEDEPSSYNSLQILTPRHGDTIRDTTNFEIIAAVDPALLPRHSARLLIDGAAVDQSQTSLQFFITDIERGAHRLEVQIIDGGNKILISTEIEIFIHRTTHIKKFAEPSGERDPGPVAETPTPAPPADAPAPGPETEAPRAAPPADSPKPAPPAESPKPAPAAAS